MRFLLLMMLYLGAAYGKPYTLVLDWHFSPHHAPLLYAKIKGHLNDWQFFEPSHGASGIKLVAAKRYDMCVSYPSYLLKAVHKKLPVKRIGTLLSRSMVALAVRDNSSIKAIADLKGKKIGRVHLGPSIYLSAFLRTGGLSIKDTHVIQVNQGILPSLMSGSIDGCLVMSNHEPILAKKQGVPLRLFPLSITDVPTSHSFVFVVSKQTTVPIKQLRDAIDKGLTACRQSPDKVWTLIERYYPRLKGKKDLFLGTLPYFSATCGAYNKKANETYARFVAKTMGWDHAPNHEDWVG
jgi:putative hydroxymethylpyrimidine transport system substrate-binding protein